MASLCFPKSTSRLLVACLTLAFVSCAAGESAVSGWLNWRGPHQNATSDETNLPDTWTPGGENCLWIADVPGQSAPVIANGRVYVMGMKGPNDANLQEGLFCLDAATGEIKWERLYNDFLSDTIYLRYASSAPVVDPESGNIFTLGSQGFMSAYDPDGKLLWQHKMMDEFGFMTFPNGRTGRPAVEGPLVILSAITANWGANGPAANRFYAFDKKTGELVWASDPGGRPHDNSATTPIFEWVGNKRVFYGCGGDGQLYCVNAYTGEAIWTYPMCRSGMSATPLRYKDMVIGVHGQENLDTATKGRMVALKIDGSTHPSLVEGKAPVLDKSAEVWRCEISGFATSPVLVGNRVYLTDDTARLCCVDADTGKLLWRKELGVEVVFSAPLYADGKLYIPLLDGHFFIVKPGDDEKSTQILSKVKLDAKCCGAPAVCDGRVYIQSGLQLDGKLYCIGKKGVNQKAPPWPAAEKHTPGALAKYLGVPADLLVHPGGTIPLRLIPCDKDGNYLPENPEDAKKAKWVRFIPPTAKVKSEVNGDVENGVFKADDKQVPSAGALKAELNGIFGYTRGRILPNLPIHPSFEKTPMLPTEADPKVEFGYPPLPWIGARFRWEVRMKDGVKCLYKTVENKLFQRAMTFISTPEMHDYTIQADVLAEADTRKIAGKEKIIKMSEVGVINQRYMIILKGMAQEMEVNSNFERIRVSVPFEWKPETWYTIKARVDVDPATGEGVVRGKAWKKGDAEPEKWTIEVPHKTAHKEGSPGLFGFAPTDIPVYVNNIAVTPNK
ncbi:MAG TPA: PQQ-binding-like beta-propeller repeat protein [Planctomycetota bacterium]|nr:PQQ-binding-like beta-propeller repeat protein [Planctomycetota bacterium]